MPPARRTYHVNPVSSGDSRPGSMISMAPTMSGSEAMADNISTRSPIGSRPMPAALVARFCALTCTEPSVASRPRVVCSARLRMSLRAVSTSSPRMAR